MFTKIFVARLRFL